MANQRMPNLLEITQILDFAGISCNSSKCKNQNTPSGTCTCTLGDYDIAYTISSTTKHFFYAIYAPEGVSKEADAIGAGFYVNTANAMLPGMTCVSKKKSTKATQICTKEHSSTRLDSNDGLEWYAW